MKWRVCSACKGHNNNPADDVCHECRETEYQRNLGE